MLVYQSKLLGKARKQPPSDAEAISHKLLARAGYIDQLASGIFSLLPLGWRVNEKIVNIIRREMEGIDAHELFLPALHPATLWEESGRLNAMDPPLFRVTDRHDKELVLASTHEEVITDLTRKYIDSYKDLPLAVFQIQTKFRNEMRSTGGLLRVREFQMKDLYSFHRTVEDLQRYYERVKQAYLAIFKACGLTVHAVEAMSGSIGGSVSHEFQVEAATGEDRVALCPKCGYAANLEALPGEKKDCPTCGTALEIKSCIENGHVFQLGTKYSQAMGAFFTDADGQKKPIIMGCYGIGIGRLLATIAEIHHDDKGLTWPKTVAPFDAHVVALQESVRDEAEKLAHELSQKIIVLFDDRRLSAGQKFAEADLIGIPRRVVVSEKTQKEGKVEVTERGEGTRTFYDPKEFIGGYGHIR
jgi:prolyl-tRNA synthetase